jgi:gluconokinase
MEHSVVVMGVAGCGKSSLGAALARAEGAPLIEGDEHHSRANLEKMQRGEPLSDADRAGWLEALAAELRARPVGAVLTCSALKRAYRERLRAACLSREPEDLGGRSLTPGPRLRTIGPCASGP